MSDVILRRGFEVKFLDAKNSCRLATATATPLPLCTAAGAGVGKTLTGSVNGALSVDGVPVVLNDRILVKDQASAIDNGIYTVTATGSPTTVWVLTRATDADESSEVTPGMYCVSEDGVTNVDYAWLLASNAPITIDVSALNFIEFQAVIAGDGLTKTGKTIDVKPTDDSVAIAADGIRAAVPTKVDKGRAPGNTSGDNADSGLTITSTPGGDGMVDVSVNGNQYVLGDGITTKDCYFSSDGTPGGVRTIAAIVAGDHFVWNGVTVGFDLATTDSIDFNYAVA